MKASKCFVFLGRLRLKRRGLRIALLVSILLLCCCLATSMVGIFSGISPLTFFGFLWGEDEQIIDSSGEDTNKRGRDISIENANGVVSESSDPRGANRSGSYGKENWPSQSGELLRSEPRVNHWDRDNNDRKDGPTPAIKKESREAKVPTTDEEEEQTITLLLPWNRKFAYKVTSPDEAIEACYAGRRKRGLEPIRLNLVYRDAIKAATNTGEKEKHSNKKDLQEKAKGDNSGERKKEIVPFIELWSRMETEKRSRILRRHLHQQQHKRENVGEKSDEQSEEIPFSSSFPVIPDGIIFDSIGNRAYDEAFYFNISSAAARGEADEVDEVRGDGDDNDERHSNGLSEGKGISDGRSRHQPRHDYSLPKKKNDRDEKLDLSKFKNVIRVLWNTENWRGRVREWNSKYRVTWLNKTYPSQPPADFFDSLAFTSLERENSEEDASDRNLRFERKPSITYAAQVEGDKTKKRKKKEILLHAPSLAPFWSHFNIIASFEKDSDVMIPYAHMYHRFERDYAGMRSVIKKGAQVPSLGHSFSSPSSSSSALELRSSSDVPPPLAIHIASNCHTDYSLLFATLQGQRGQRSSLFVSNVSEVGKRAHDQKRLDCSQHAAEDYFENAFVSARSTSSSTSTMLNGNEHGKNTQPRRHRGSSSKKHRIALLKAINEVRAFSGGSEVGKYSGHFGIGIGIGIGSGGVGQGQQRTTSRTKNEAPPFATVFGMCGGHPDGSPEASMRVNGCEGDVGVVPTTYEQLSKIVYTTSTGSCAPSFGETMRGPEDQHKYQTTSEAEHTKIHRHLHLDVRAELDYADGGSYKDKIDSSGPHSSGTAHKKKYYSPANPRKGCLMRRHLFYFALENSIFADYVTEKLYEPLSVGGSWSRGGERCRFTRGSDRGDGDGNNGGDASAGIKEREGEKEILKDETEGPIPVYLGSPNVADFAPADHSLINAADFPTVKELKRYLICVSQNKSVADYYRSWRSRVHLGGNNKKREKISSRKGKEAALQLSKTSLEMTTQDDDLVASKSKEKKERKLSFADLANSSPLCEIAEHIYEDKKIIMREIPRGNTKSKFNSFQQQYNGYVPLNRRRGKPPMPTALDRPCGWVSPWSHDTVVGGASCTSDESVVPCCDYSQFATDQSPLPCSISLDAFTDMYGTREKKDRN